MTEKFIPEIEFTPEGLVLPTEQEILDGAFNMLDAAFGTKFNRNLETPQGQLASSLAAILADKNNQIAWIVNNLDPQYSEGSMQDAVGRIYFINRKPGVNSQDVCVFIGLPGTFIPKGFVLEDTNRNQWVTQSDLIINSNGEVSGVVIANGSYTAEANTITVIYKSLVGLDRVYNPNPSIKGVDVESREDFAARRRKSVAKNSQSMVASVYGNVAALDGVIDCYVIDNPTDRTIRYGATSYPIKPHSVYVSVVGGDDHQIAKTIWTYSGNGCDFNGGVKIKVEDETYDHPKPTYEISFNRPTNTPVYFKVKVKKGLIDTYINDMKDAIKKAFNSSSQHRTGKTCYAVDYIYAVRNVLPVGYLLGISISVDGISFAEQVELGIDQYPIIQDDKIMAVS